MNPTTILGLLFIATFLVGLYVRQNKKTEGFSADQCGTSPKEVFSKTAKAPTGPLKFCNPKTRSFYKELGRIKGSGSKPKDFIFTPSEGVNPVRNLTPGTEAYMNTLASIGTSVLDPGSWSINKPTTESNAPNQANICGTSRNDVYMSSSKTPTGPLKFCNPMSPPFYSELARIKGTEVTDPKHFVFTLPGGANPVKDQIPGTQGYIQGLQAVGTAVFDPDNWLYVAGSNQVNAAPPVNAIASLPMPKGTGVIPNTMPGSTSSNSTIALASIKDLIALRDSLATFNELYEKNIQAYSKNMYLQNLHSNAVMYKIRLQAQIDTGKVVDRLEFASTERAKYEKMIVDLRQGLLPGHIAKREVNIPVDPSRLSLADLDGAIIRIRAEKQRIDNLRSTSTDLLKRASVLEKVGIDLHDMESRIRRGEMKLQELPFTKIQLAKFLQDVNVPSSTLAPLNPLKKAEFPTMVSTHPELPIPANLIQDLSWGVHVDYDPKDTLYRETLERMAYLTKNIDNGKIKGLGLVAALKELDGLKNTLGLQNQHARKHKRRTQSPKYKSVTNKQTLMSHKKSMQKRHLFAHEGFDDEFEPSINTSVPVKSELITPLEHDNTPDWGNRPEPTLRTIQNRASNASFKDVIHTSDYKGRVKFLCSQIQGSGLGDPKEFGCTDPAVVGPDYSWHGNYKMVCSRLGHTWGDWYPEMFGCPRENVAFQQTPVIFLGK
jgi:hypothetical protein